MVTTKREILDAAIAVLSRGEPLTIDAVARECGLTKPGVVHHFATKEVLTTAVVDRIIERWEGEMRARTPDDGGDPIGRLRAYVDFALTGEFDQSDLALPSRRATARRAEPPMDRASGPVVRDRRRRRLGASSQVAGGSSARGRDVVQRTPRYADDERRGTQRSPPIGPADAG